jgi:hypothetical protein
MGIEFAVNGTRQSLLYGVSATFSDNTWQNLDVQEIFGEKKEDVEGKHVPFSPSTMITAEVGWNFGDSPLKVILGGQFWDGYYGSYTNTYYTQYDSDGNPVGASVEAKLPYFFDLYTRVVYDLRVPGAHMRFILTANNLLNREDNFAKAEWGQDFNRNDNLAGQYYMYVAQAPLRNVFLTFQLDI